MGANIRRLGPGDEHVLAQLNEQDADFALPEHGAPRQQLPAAAGRDYLSDPSVLHWVAEDQDDAVIGHLLCYVQRRRRGEARQVMVYEIGVREAHRRRDVGRSLIRTMQSWMQEHGVREAWVLADNRGAEEFYAACGFVRDPDQAVLMSYLPTYVDVLAWPEARSGR